MLLLHDRRNFCEPLNLNLSLVLFVILFSVGSLVNLNFLLHSSFSLCFSCVSCIPHLCLGLFWFFSPKIEIDSWHYCYEEKYLVSTSYWEFGVLNDLSNIFCCDFVDAKCFYSYIMVFFCSGSSLEDI